ncbi:MAG: UDP-2,3-diacylglucosamine diphosphatase [Bdellovibrio sp.]|nr:UDP-2,3-diacylglucosamine diphosphatase [Bdellovibrio sp.]
MISWFISDIHLKNVNERNGNTLLRFLFLLNENPKEHRLFMLGDIFDFWLSNGQAFRDHYQVLIAQIEKFKKAGGEVHYFEGNHDFHVDVFWTKYLDIPVYEDEAFFNIDGMKVRLEHGDFINPDDVAYLKYRSIVRHRFIEPIGHMVPGWFWKWFGEKESQKSRKKSVGYMIQNADKVKNLIHTHVEKVYAEKPFDLVVTGHMHIFDDYEFSRDGKKIRSVNLGTWLDQPRALRIENAQMQVVNLHNLLNKN